MRAAILCGRILLSHPGLPKRRQAHAPVRAVPSGPHSEQTLRGVILCRNMHMLSHAILVEMNVMGRGC